MKHFLIVLCCAFVFTALSGAPVAKDKVKWGNDIAEAQKSIKGTKRSVLLFFTAPGWCGPCRRLESGAVGSSKFAKIAKENAAVRLDFSDRKNVSEKAKAALSYYKVQGFPSLLVLDDEGKEKGRIVGALPEKEFFAELEKLLKK